MSSSSCCMLLGYLVLKGYKDKDDTSSNFYPAAQRIEAIVQSQKTAAYQRKCNHHLNKYYPKMNDFKGCLKTIECFISFSPLSRTLLQ